MCRLYGFLQPEPSGLSFLFALDDDSCRTDWEVGSVESLIGRHLWSWCDDGAAYHDLFRNYFDGNWMAGLFNCFIYLSENRANSSFTIRWAVMVAAPTRMAVSNETPVPPRASN